MATASSWWAAPSWNVWLCALPPFSASLYPPLYSPLHNMSPRLVVTSFPSRFPAARILILINSIFPSRAAPLISYGQTSLNVHSGHSLPNNPTFLLLVLNVKLIEIRSRIRQLSSSTHQTTAAWKRFREPKSSHWQEAEPSVAGGTEQRDFGWKSCSGLLEEFTTSHVSVCWKILSRSISVIKRFISAYCNIKICYNINLV